MGTTAALLPLLAALTSSPPAGLGAAAPVSMTHWCGEGRAAAAAKPPAFAAFPASPEPIRCTATGIWRLDSVKGTGDIFEAEVDLHSERAADSDALMVAAEGVDAAGEVKLARILGVPLAHNGGDDQESKWRVRLPLIAGVDGVRILVSEAGGTAVHVAMPEIRRVEPHPATLPEHVRRILDIYRSHAFVYTAGVDWDSVAVRLAMMAEDAAPGAATESAVVWNLNRSLRLAHSFYLSPGAQARAGCDAPLQVHPLSGEGELQLVLEGFSGDGACQDRYVREGVRSVKAALQQSGIDRVTIDLRANTGGNMWPMLHVLLPFFDEGRLLGFQRPGAEGDSIHWVELRGGRLLEAGRAILPDYGVQAMRSSLPVRVLVCGRTGSSGEAVAMALRTSGATLTGSQTYGFTTSNEPFDLPSGGTLFLTTANMVYIDGSHPARVAPDVTDPAICE